MILNHRPLKGALFGSAFPPTDELESLARTIGPNMALFYQNFEVILFAPALRMIWPEAALGMDVDTFRNFIGHVVAPAEKLHLAGFWESVKREGGNGSDVFLLRSGRMRDASMLGLAFFSFAWGSFMVAIPGESLVQVREILANLAMGGTSRAWEAMDFWVEDLETECILTPLLELFPEEFRSTAGFLRTVHVPIHDGRIQTYEVAYKYRNKKWHRDISEGLLLDPFNRIVPAWTRPGGKATETQDEPVLREKGIRVGNEIVIKFTAFLGGVFPLGDIPVPVHVLAKGGMVRINRLIREISNGIVPHAQPLTSEHYRFCRFWTENGFAIEGLEEIARIVDPADWKHLMVLPFWETGAHSLTEIRSYCRVSDAFFVDPKKNMGLLLLRDCGEALARGVVVRQFKRRVRALVDRPLTVEHFLRGE